MSSESTTRSEIARVFTDLEKAQLVSEQFRKVNLDFVDFRHADLRHARFEEVSLVGCDFADADLRCAEFYHCDLRQACFSRVQWTSNVFYGCLFHGASGLSPPDIFHIQICGGSFFPIGSPHDLRAK